jgi:hypothetical protein
MDTLIELITEENTLQLAIGAHEWCRCTLVQGERQTYLGSETMTYVAGHLLELLREQPDEAAEGSKSSPWIWVLSLTEAHATLYLMERTKQHGLDLLWQDEEAKEIGHMRLSSEEAARWRVQLSELIL